MKKLTSIIACATALLLPSCLVSTCNRAGAPSAVRVESVTACHGTWQMKHHDAYPQQGYASGKQFTLHSDGRADCNSLLRRDLGEYYDSPDTPVPAQGTWQLADDSSGTEAQYVTIRFDDGFSTTARFYRKNGYWEGERELWFIFGDEDNLRWAQYVREK